MISKFTTVILDDKNIDAIKNNRKLFDRTFNENGENNQQLMSCVPNKDLISSYCKNIIITSKMEKEVPILCLVYIERLLIKSGFGMNGLNWRKILLISLIMASKIWDDESFENDNFAKAFP